MASKSRRGIISLLTIAFLAGTAHADVNQSFVWGFKTFTSLSLPECGRLQIYLDTSGMSTPAQPPYTLFAYESGGIPTRQLVGSDPNNLFWTVDHASQSQLAISMADSAGNTGGVGQPVYTVVPSTSGTACHANSPISPISMTTNTTNAITTCEVLPLRMSGGTKPYTVTVAFLNSVVTNFTLGAAFDTYNWVNRASPNSQIIASVSDAQGVYAPSTNILSTSGSTDVTCANQTSTEFDSSAQTSAAQSSTSAATAPSGGSSGSNSSASSSSPSTSAIVGGSLGGAVLIVALVLGAFFFPMWRRATAQRPYPLDDGYNGFGSGKVGDPVPGQKAPFSSVSGEISPYVTSGAQATPYMDNPPYQYSTYTSNYSIATPEATLAPATQSRTSTYSAAPYAPPGAALPYAMQQNLGSNAVISPPPSAADFDPYAAYAAGSVAPSNPSESTDASTAMRIAGAGYAARGGSVAGSAEAGPSSGRFAVANPNPLDDDEKLGPEPPEQRRETVYQHEDISDVTEAEVPPAYKSTTDH